MPNKGGVVTQSTNVQKLNYLHELTKTNTKGYKLVFQKGPCDSSHNIYWIVKQKKYFQL